MNKYFAVKMIFLFSMTVSCMPEDKVCEAGSTQKCYCTNSMMGAQTCSANGDSWGICKCSKLVDSGIDLKNPDSAIVDMILDKNPVDSVSKIDTITYDYYVPDLPKLDSSKCNKHSDCNDGNKCTTDICSISGCMNVIDGNYCLINKQCIASSSLMKANSCLICKPLINKINWSYNDGYKCDDNKLCTYADTCTSGTCKGTAYSCDDGKSCTDDKCTGLSASPAGCSFTIKNNTCLIDKACMNTGKMKSGSKCEWCDSKETNTTWSYKPKCVVTIGGTGTSGLKDGSADQSQFWNPYGVAVDKAGNVYVADFKNHAVRVINKNKVSTIAGGKPGYVDGPVSIARFQYPADVAVDLNGDIIVADNGNKMIRKITNGYVTTIAGDGSTGYLDGLAIKAKFLTLTDISTDSKGDIYLADQGNQVIRKISGGYVTTIAGNNNYGYKDGPALKSMFGAPGGTSVDSNFRVYVADQGNSKIRMLLSGNMTTIAGIGKGSKDGLLNVASFDNPSALVVDSKGIVFVSEVGNHKVRKVTGVDVKTLAGSIKGFTDGPANTAKFSSPVDIAIDSKGRLYVADYDNHAIRMVIP